jgi:hypothetical protein
MRYYIAAAALALRGEMRIKTIMLAGAAAAALLAAAPAFAAMEASHLQSEHCASWLLFG